MKQQKAYDLWLGFLTPLRWSSIIIGVVLPSVAGVALFATAVGEENWKIIASVIMLISGIVSGLHTALKCDAHQADCLRLSRRYEVLAEKFQEAMMSSEGEELKQNHKTLGAEFLTLKEETLTTPAQWCYRKAERLIASSKKS